MSDSDLTERFTVEDLKESRILEALVSHGGEVKLGSLKSTVVDELEAMSRPTFYEKIKVLERGGWIHRDPRMAGNTAVAYVVIVEPFLSILRHRDADPFTQAMAEATERLRDPSTSVEEKETLVEMLLEEYLRCSYAWILDVVRVCLEAESGEEAARVLSLSTRYLFGQYLAEVGLLCWEFKPYGVGALDGIREYLASLQMGKIRPISDSIREVGAVEDDLQRGR